MYPVGLIDGAYGCEVVREGSEFEFILGILKQYATSYMYIQDILLNF